MNSVILSLLTERRSGFATLTTRFFSLVPNVLGLLHCSPRFTGSPWPREPSTRFNLLSWAPHLHTSLTDWNCTNRPHLRTLPPPGGRGILIRVLPLVWNLRAFSLIPLFYGPLLFFCLVLLLFLSSFFGYWPIHLPFISPNLVFSTDRLFRLALVLYLSG